MNRMEKLKLLQAIKEGKVSPESLHEPQVYFFDERSDKPGVYEMDGKEYTETEYREFCDKIKRKNSNSQIWNEGKDFPKGDTIITFVKHPKRGVNYLTLNL